jgi:hypothetical protein
MLSVLTQNGVYRLSKTTSTLMNIVERKQMKLSLDGRTVFDLGDDSIRVIDLETNECIREFDTPGALSFDISLNRLMYSDGRIKTIMNLNDGSTIGTINIGINRSQTEISVNDEIVFITLPFAILVHSGITGEFVSKIQFTESTVQDACVSPDGQMLAIVLKSNGRSRLSCRETMTGFEVSSMDLIGNTFIAEPAFSPNSEFVVLATERVLVTMLWSVLGVNVKTGTLMFTFEFLSTLVFAISPDSGSLAVSNVGRVSVIDLLRREKLYDIPVESDVYEIVFSD